MTVDDVEGFTYLVSNDDVNYEQDLNSWKS